MKKLTLDKEQLIRYSSNVLNVVLVGCIVGTGQEIYQNFEQHHVGAGLVRLTALEIGGVARIVLGMTLGPKNTIRPESILFIGNTIQITQFFAYT